MPLGTKNPKINSSVKHYALYRTFERALDQCKDFKPRVLWHWSLLSEEPPDDFKACAIAVLYDGIERDEWDHVGYACVSAILLALARELEEIVAVLPDRFDELRNELEGSGTVVGINHAQHLSAEAVKSAADCMRTSAEQEARR
ncbi:hypothetical protein [Rhizobium leguminosarum]|uniref:hypothetical protein n=1 Tax=Rhizobium leguminosarum TaxID=384 RepID=UPI0019D4740A|nr:hypothetical protein [Rhizobium leguminosarum]